MNSLEGIRITGEEGSSVSPEELMQAHQFLYYVQGRPGWSDAAYDRFCKAHGLAGNGGSDMADSYPPKVKALAASITRQPSEFYRFIPQ